MSKKSKHLSKSQSISKKSPLRTNLIPEPLQQPQDSAENNDLEVNSSLRRKNACLDCYRFISVEPSSEAQNVGQPRINASTRPLSPPTLASHSKSVAAFIAYLLATGRRVGNVDWPSSLQSQLGHKTPVTTRYYVSKQKSRARTREEKLAALFEALPALKQLGHSQLPASTSDSDKGEEE